MAMPVKLRIFFQRSFDAVTCNPPYRKINSGRVNPAEEKAIARHEIQDEKRKKGVKSTFDYLRIS